MILNIAKCKVEQSKTVSPQTEAITVYPDTGKALSAVTVGAIPTESVNLTVNGSFVATPGSYITGGTVAIPEYRPFSDGYHANCTVPSANKLVTGDIVIDVTLPQLHAPVISIDGQILTISNPAANGDFVDEYRVTVGTQLIYTTETTLNLAEYLAESGTYSVHAYSYGAYFADSATSNTIDFYYLAPPSVILVTGSTVTYAGVGEATAYEVIIDGESVGEVT